MSTSEGIHKNPCIHFMGIVEHEKERKMQFMIEWKEKEIAVVFNEKDFTLYLLVVFLNQGLYEIFNGAGVEKGHYRFGEDFSNK